MVVADFIGALLHVGEFLYNILHGLHRAWDMIGGLTGLFYGLIVGGCLLGLVWTFRAYWPKATALIASDEAEEQRIAEIVEPITEPMPVVSVPQHKDVQDALADEIKKVVAMAEIELSLLWEKKEQEEEK